VNKDCHTEIWRYGVRSCRKKERKRVTEVCSHNTTSLIRKFHAARVFHTSFSARRGHWGSVSSQLVAKASKEEEEVVVVVVEASLNSNDTCKGTAVTVSVCVCPPRSPHSRQA
jgi:hypothetical protein